MLINNDKMPESYLAHHVFDDIEYMRDFYDRLSDRCFYFIPSGTRGITNYASYIYMSYRGTLKSIKMLLENGNINDALVLVRKLYDDVLVDIYIDVLRKDRFRLHKRSGKAFGWYSCHPKTNFYDSFGFYLLYE